MAQWKYITINSQYVCTPSSTGMAFWRCWQSWMLACQNKGQNDRHVSVRPTCRRHVSQHVGNMIQKADGRGTGLTCHSMSLADMLATCWQHACLSCWHLCHASLFRHCLLSIVDCCWCPPPLLSLPLYLLPLLPPLLLPPPLSSPLLLSSWLLSSLSLSSLSSSSSS